MQLISDFPTIESKTERKKKKRFFLSLRFTLAHYLHYDLAVNKASSDWKTKRQPLAKIIRVMVKEVSFVTLQSKELKGW